MKKIFTVLFIALVAICTVSAADNKNVELPATWESDYWGTASYGLNGATACANPIAAQIGVEILEKGGNAVDAAVAMIYAVGLLEPAASGMGGCGQMLVYLADQDKYVNIEYLTQVPSGAEFGVTDADGNSNPPSTQSLAIPGLVHGTMTALEKYGTMTPREVLQPVIDLARNGFDLPERWNSNLDGRYANLSSYDYTLGLYTDNGVFYTEYDTITNNDLADTLEVIANGGKEAFYDSAFTDKMCDYIQSIGGILTREDFANYKTVIREPISTNYRGYNVYTVSSPTKGGVALLEALNIAEQFPINEWEFDDPKTIQVLAECFLAGCKDGNTYVSDENFYNLPIDTLISKEYAATRVKQVVPGRRNRNLSAGFFQVTKKESNEQMGTNTVQDPGGTTHLAVMDKYGNVVSTTNTNGQNFGSAVAVPGTGFVFNAHLMLFDNAGTKKIDMLQPGAKTSSTICPTIIADENGKPLVALGSPGNWCTCSAAFAGVVYYCDFEMNVAEMVNYGRVYRDYQTLKGLEIDSDWFSESTIQGLKDMGFDIVGSSSSAGYNSHVGSLAAVEIRDGIYWAAGDYRRFYGTAAY